MSLEGKVCIVTGASSGIGEAIAVLFAERKASVVLCGRSESRLDKILKQCQEISGDKDRYITVTGDLKEQEVRSKIVQATIDKFGRVDVLIPNAGVISKPAPISDITEEMYDEVMNVNTKSVFFLIKEAVPWLEKSKGNIVCVSSISAHITTKSTVYCMSKASLDHLCRCLATDLGPKGIRVNTVNPTFVQSRLLRTVMPHLEEAEDLSSTDAFYQKKGSPHPLGGRIATPEEVARATAFLASDEASFVTGQSLDVDGGISLSCIASQP